MSHFFINVEYSSVIAFFHPRLLMASCRFLGSEEEIVCAFVVARFLTVTAQQMFLIFLSVPSLHGLLIHWIWN
jgi:hypothetical protein